MTAPAPSLEAPREAKSGPSKRAIIGGTVAMLVVAGLAWGAVYLASCLSIRNTVSSFSGYGDESRCVEQLGGPRSAREKLEWYLDLPDRYAPHRRWAIQILGACGQPAVPILARHLRKTGGPEFLPLAVGEVLGSSQFDISEAVPGLLHCARSSNGSERWAAVFALQRYKQGGAHDEEVFTTLLKAVADVDSPTRTHALRVLAKYGSRSEQVIPELEKALKDKDPDVRQAATEALKKIKAAQEKEQ